MSLSGSKRQRTGINFNEGSWNEEECLKYLIFLDLNKSIMTSRQKKKIYRVFDKMSHFIGTRTSLQCRSHHQKAIQRHKHVKQIIEHQKKPLDIHIYRIKVKEARDSAKIKENPKNPTSNLSINSDISTKSPNVMMDANRISYMTNITATNFNNIFPIDFYSMYQYSMNNFGLQFYCFPNFSMN